MEEEHKPFNGCLWVLVAAVVWFVWWCMPDDIPQPVDADAPVSIEPTREPIAAAQLTEEQRLERIKTFCSVRAAVSYSCPGLQLMNNLVQEVELEIGYQPDVPEHKSACVAGWPLNDALEAADEYHCLTVANKYGCYGYEWTGLVVGSPLPGKPYKRCLYNGIGKAPQALVDG